MGKDYEEIYYKILEFVEDNLKMNLILLSRVDKSNHLVYLKAFLKGRIKTYYEILNKFYGERV